MKMQNLKEKKFLNRQKEAIVCAPGQAASGPSHPLSTPGELSCPAHSALPRGEAAGGPPWCLLPQPSHASLTFPSRWLLTVCTVVLVAPDAQGEDRAPPLWGLVPFCSVSRPHPPLPPQIAKPPPPLLSTVFISILQACQPPSSFSP